MRVFVRHKSSCQDRAPRHGLAFGIAMRIRRCHRPSPSLAYKFQAVFNPRRPSPSLPRATIVDVHNLASGEMSAAAASSSVVVLDAVADTDTATSPYFAEGAAAAAFSWPAAERTQSTLRRLREDRHGVPKEYTTSFAGDKAACAADCPGDTIAVYADALDAGMRVPLHGFHAALLRHYGLAPAQLAPNAWRYVAAFVLLCQDAGVEPMLSVFQHFFSICTHKGDAAGWHHFKPSNHAGSSRRLFSEKISKTMYAGWKNRFFFLKASQDAPWPCPVKWGKPTRVAVRKPGLTAAASAAVEKLLDRVGASGINVAQFLSRRSPPIGRTPEPAAVKKEPGTTVEQTRKRKSAEPVDATTSTPTSSAAHRAGPPACSAAAGEGERSATASFASRLAQLVEAELDKKEQELQARYGEISRLKKKLRARDADVARLGEELRAATVSRDADVARLGEELRASRAAHEAEVARLRAATDARDADVARLGDELRAATDAHAADVARLGEELQQADAARAAEVSQLREELQKANAAHADEASRLAAELQNAQSERAAEVQALRMQHQRELTGLCEMRQLALVMYRHAVDLSELKQELLPDDCKDGELEPPQPPAEDQ